MGRLHKDDRPDTAASSHSLHSIDDDLPPPYTDEPNIGPSSHTSTSGTAPLPIHLRLVDSAYILPDSTIKADDKCAISLAPTLSRNSNELFHAIRRQMKLPPRPLIYVKGTHTESKSNAKKGANNSVTDFEFKLDLAETMLTGWEGESQMGIKWVEEEVLTDEDHKPAFRGGRFKSRTYVANSLRAPHSEDSDALLASDSVLGADDAPEQPSTNNEAQLKMWCERFCNDPSTVKSYVIVSREIHIVLSTDTNFLSPRRRFTLHRKISGFDWKAMRNVLASHIRELNYLGSVAFQFDIAQQSVTIYSPHWINRMRANRYIWWAFVILQLWIIAWPIIWFMESRYELVHTRWHSSVSFDMTGLSKEYARGRDEATLGEFWAPAVKRAAWSKRCGQGNTLTRMDAERVQGLTQNQLLGLEQRTDSEAEQERRGRINNGNGGFMDHVVGFVRGVGEVGQDWRLTMGWGGNS
ncbi:hypothetical protein N7478_002663 [Penicillium angulare]|uniref:uncharacterized protein n=1 Tax=Penicillium angulare TaxID=116970 RepID=UPI0025412DAE|nr:uncharacterized protein N7478_002663 [Penicillium angulare]KAJ5286977.1 hypothetical protein N7478_002663 [Penicillium angulare]